MATQSTPIAQIGTTYQPIVPSKSLLQRALYRIRRDRLTLVSIMILLVFAVVSYSAPFITTNILQTSHTKPNLDNVYQPIGTEGHILGTDELGRDHLARLLYGGRISLSIGFVAASLAMTIGIVLGVISGYYGGILDDIMIWFVTTLNSLPGLFLLLMISALLSPGPVTLVLVLSFLGWTGSMRLMRGETFKLREREYVLSARALGASDLRIMFAHIAPNAVSLLLVSLARAIGGLILAESSLSFLGFGIKPPIPTWGNMLTDGLTLVSKAPHLLFAPGLLITVTVLCLYIIGDGLRDAFDPRISD